ncbi:MAG TPA: GDP-mannose 4,6-dehydratase [Oligoflexia bacterium]|nr:GDP-mannose 4,6-dehydratase [Oligoflexia bacterium]HMP26662.1 GDP-mannose 4,6-dehydratase [Oligoflexia bacterium]
MKGKKCLLTGGAGFIGSHVVDNLKARGIDQLLVIDNLSSGSKANLTNGVELFEIDIRDNAARDALKKFEPDAIIHLAAQISVRKSMEDPRFDLDVNVSGLVNLLQATLELPQKPHFIFISTGGAIYGEQNFFPATEDHPTNPASAYGLAKRVGEMYLDLWSKEYGLQYCSLRLSNVYGPRQSPHGEAGVVAIFCKRLLNGQPLIVNGDGLQTRDYVYALDVANAVGEVVEKEIRGIYNIGTGIEHTVLDIITELKKSSTRAEKVIVEHAPPKPGEQKRSVISYNRAKEAFGWEPTVGFEKGIQETLAWFSKEK